MAEEKNKGGRPRKYVGRRPTWTIRLEQALGDEVRKIAQESGLSNSEVCEQQIRKGLRLNEYIDLLRTKNVEYHQMYVETLHQLQLSREQLAVAEAKLSERENIEEIIEQAVRRGGDEDTIPGEQKIHARRRSGRDRRFWKAQAKLARLQRH